jgi:hypothetical protein
MKPHRVSSLFSVALAAILAGCAHPVPIVPALEGKPFIPINKVPASDAPAASPTTPAL